MRSKLTRIVSVIMTIFLLTILLLQILSMFRQADWEIRVGEVKIATKIISDLANNNNPYGTEWLYNTEELPPTYYESGFFHVLPSVLLLRVLPITVYQAAAFVHCAYVLIALLVMYLVVKRLTGNLSLSIFSMNAYFYCLNAYMCTNQRPDTLCSLCCILVLYLLLLDKEVILESYKSSKLLFVSTENNVCFYIREWIIAFLCVLLIFLKIHYASIIFALFFYYVKRKRILPIIAKGALFVGLFIFLCNIYFPTFFSTFGVRVLEMLRQNSADQSSYAEMWQKWWKLVLIFPLFFAVTITGVFKIRDFGRDGIGTFMAIHIMFNFVALCFMGKWPGNGIIYHEVMLMPIMIPASLWLLTCWNRRLRKHELWLESILILLSLFFLGKSEGFPDANFGKNRDAAMVRLQQMEELDQYKSKYMLLAPYYAFYAFQNDMYQWNYGDQIYIPYNIGTSPRWNFLFPYTNLYRDRCRDYCAYMLELINNREYSIIITDDIFILGLKLGYEQEFETALDGNYQVIKDEGGFKYYIPK